MCGGIPPHTQRRDREERLHKTLAVVLRALAPSVPSRPAGVFSSHVHTGTRKRTTCAAATCCFRLQIKCGCGCGGDAAQKTSLETSVCCGWAMWPQSPPASASARPQAGQVAKGLCTPSSAFISIAQAKKKIVVWTWVERGVSRRASRAKHKIERRCGVGCRPVWVRQRGHEW